MGSGKSIGSSAQENLWTGGILRRPKAPIRASGATWFLLILIHSSRRCRVCVQAERDLGPGGMVFAASGVLPSHWAHTLPCASVLCSAFLGVFASAPSCAASSPVWDRPWCCPASGRGRLLVPSRPRFRLIAALGESLVPSRRPRRVRRRAFIVTPQPRALSKKGLRGLPPVLTCEPIPPGLRAAGLKLAALWLTTIS